MSNFDLDKAKTRFDRFTSKGGDIEVVKKNGDVVYLDDISNEEENMIIDDTSEEYTSEEEYYEEPPPKNKYVYRDVPKQTLKYEVPKPETKEEVKKFSGLLGRRLFQ